MKRNGLLGLLGATVASLAGCGYDATSNTLPVQDGRETLSLGSARVDYINAVHDKYAVVPRTPDTVVNMNIPGYGEFVMPKNLLADGRLIPDGNSTMIRTPKAVEMRANGESSFLVNAYIDADHKLVINTEGEPKTSYFVVDTRVVDAKREGNSEQVEARVMNYLAQKADTITVGKRTFLGIPTLDTEGRSARIYVDTNGMYPRYEESHVPGQKPSAKLGIVGTGYLIHSGREVAKKKESTLEQQFNLLLDQSGPVN